MSEDVDVDDKGQVIVHPLVSWRLGHAFETAAFLQLNYSPAPDVFDRLSRLQLAVPAKYCRDLAADLVAMAERLERPPPSATPH
jgi:hypothetical protein